MFFYKLIILLIYAIQQATSLKCYSCGDENQFLGPEYPNPLPCPDMDKSEDLTKFVIECPDEYLSCITQSKGKELMRTCDTLAIDDDCKTANGITYCYCSMDLCNGKQSRNDARKSLRDLDNNYPSDDEDYEDEHFHENQEHGSGFRQNNDGGNEDEFENDKMHREIEVVLNRNNASRNINLIINFNYIFNYFSITMFIDRVFRRRRFI